MERRRFLQASAATVVAATFGGQFWKTAYASPAIPAPGPYGPLAATPDVNGLHLPAGFTSRIVGVAGQPVSGSSYVWHDNPDGGATYIHPDGSWTYVSNEESTPGGAGSITFAADGTITGARRILDGTRNNCAGGPTTWGTWMSCEETGDGWIFDCQPLGPPASAIRLDALGQREHEAAAVDAVGKVIYTTEDDGSSRFYRWVANEWTGPTPNFAAGGQLQALSADLTAAATGPTPITWVNVNDLTTGYRGADTSVFQRGEGCWIDGRVVYFCTTTDSNVWAVDGAAQTIELVYIGGSGSLSQADNVTVHAPSRDLFVAEDAGDLELVIITSPYDNGQRAVTPFMRFATLPDAGSEVAGPAFSPDGTRLYVSSQRGSVANPGGGGQGVTYEITGPFRSTPGGPGGPQPPVGVVELVPYLSTWRILDDGSDKTPSFAAVGFDDSAWKVQTLAPGKVFGYGDGDAMGDISFGPDAAMKYRTTYFRHVFNVADPAALTSLTVTLVRDDGAVVYLNGVEVWRENIPAGPLTYLTYANDAGDERLERVNAIANNLVAGDNTIAVEVHQNSNSSSDIAFKLKLTAAAAPPTDIPEVAAPVLLGVGAAAVLGTAAFVHHRRSAAELPSAT